MESGEGHVECHQATEAGDHAVDAAQLAARGSHHPFDVVAVAHVGDQRYRTAAGCEDQLHRGLRRVLARVDDRDVGAGTGSCHRYRMTNSTATTTDDQGSAALKGLSTSGAQGDPPSSGHDRGVLHECWVTARVSAAVNAHIDTDGTGMQEWDSAPTAIACLRWVFRS